MNCTLLNCFVPAINAKRTIAQICMSTSTIHQAVLAVLLPDKTIAVEFQRLIVSQSICDMMQGCT